MNFVVARRAILWPFDTAKTAAARAISAGSLKCSQIFFISVCPSSGSGYRPDESTENQFNHNEVNLFQQTGLIFISHEPPPLFHYSKLKARSGCFGLFGLSVRAASSRQDNFVLWAFRDGNYHPHSESDCYYNSPSKGEA